MTGDAAMPDRPPPLVLRVFVSSPGDVAQERADALALLRGLGSEAWTGGRVVVQPVLWDDPDAPAPMDARGGGQDSVDAVKGTPAGCDLTIVVLWSRLGSPPGRLRGDGSRYESGTEWEFEDALAADKPVWVYRRTETPQRPLRPPGAPDTPEDAERSRQYQAVQRFFERFTAADGTVRRSYWPYADAAAFAPLLKKHLAAFVGQKLRQAAAVPALAPAPATAGDAPPYLVPGIARDYAVVGRDAALDGVWRELVAGHTCCLVLVPGIGKTTAALELAGRRDAVLGHFDGALWADLGLRPDLAQQLRRWAEALGTPAARRAEMTSIEDWKALVRAAIGARRLLLVLDDVWSADGGNEFLSLGPRCVGLLTTRLRPVADALVRQVDIVALAPLTEAEALSLLRDIAPHAVEADADAARALIDAVQGLPLALVLMGKYLKRESGDRDPDRVREAFQNLTQAGERLKLENTDRRTLEQIIDVSVSALRSDAARRALEHLSIFRPKPHAFTKAMARDICGASSDALYELSDVGLLEHRGHGDYTMHRIVGDYAREKLPRPQKARLNRKALDWYGRKLREGVGDDPQAYLSWYRYEQADWQAVKDAWLHHLAASGDVAASSLAFLRVYLDAFWWWGYYQRFPFCDRLIQEWLMRDVGAEQQRALVALRDFQQAYPAGREKRVDGARWRRVEDALRTVRRSVGLDGEPAVPDASADSGAGESDDARQVRGFIDFFLAEATAYGRHDRPRALALYTAAHDRFAATGGAWQAAWIWFYVGQYLQDEGDAAGAAVHALRSLAEVDALPAQGEPDPELPANDHRLLGDTRLAAGDPGGAARHWRKALCHAFAFQAFPQPADTYTTAFYREICERIAGALLALHARDPTGARVLCDDLHAYWAPWWQRHPAAAGAVDPAQALATGDAAALVAALFPAVPGDDDLLERAVPFALEVRRVAGALRAAAGLAATAPADAGTAAAAGS